MLWVFPSLSFAHVQKLIRARIQEELDRRETQINNLVTENSELHETVDTLRSELSSLSQESSHLSAQLAQLRSQSDSSSSDVLSLTREMRELRGEMERLRLEREEWEVEAGRERERRETLEDDLRVFERREQDMCNALEKLAEERDKEKERGDNLQEVLSEFQAGESLENGQFCKVDNINKLHSERFRNTTGNYRT